MILKIGRIESKELKPDEKHRQYTVNGVDDADAVIRMGPNKIQGSKNTWLIGQNGITSTRITSTSDVTQGIEMPVVGDVMSSPSPIGNNDNASELL